MNKLNNFCFDKLLRKMNFRKLFTFCFLLTSFAVFAPGQKNDDQYREEQARMDHERRQQEISEISKRLANPDFEYLESFLPPQKNPWYIVLTSSGGILGGRQILAAVNSAGNYSCSFGQDFSDQRVAKERFDQFAKEILSLNFAKIQSEQDVLFGCKDCISKTLTFHNGKKTFEFDGLNAGSDMQLRELFDQVMNLANCR